MNGPRRTSRKSGLGFLFCGILALCILALVACSAPQEPAAAPASAPQKPAAAQPSSPQKPAEAPAAAPQKPATMQKVVASFPAMFLIDMSYVLARDKGYFKEEGLDVEFTLVQGPEAISALVSGSLHFEGSGATQVVANIKGAPVKRLFTSYTTFPFWIYAKKEIKTVADLKGKSIGVPSMGADGPYLETREVVKRKGLDPDKDIRWVAVGMEGLAGLKGGSIDAFMAFMPFNFLAREAGFSEVVFFPDVLDADLTYGFGTSEKLIKENPDMVSKFLRAILKGHIALFADKETAVNTYVRESKVDPKVASEIYDLDKKLYDSNKLSRDGSVSDAILKSSIDFAIGVLGETTSVAPDKVYDQSFVKKAYKELQDSGWKPR